MERVRGRGRERVGGGRMCVREGGREGERESKSKSKRMEMWRKEGVVISSM